ncbi:MAG TPA: UDP-N-acetylmuramoyl-tripeptide--D-alanyl-D-alanine ligase [Terriglobales bacterium]|nr:UDP-N-acetylmuramoyl-tripeptide--D-alanyl-D-alanine ligase [Terriglobales bacterium]
MNLTLRQIADYISATGEFDGSRIATGYSIDSRTISEGQLFCAIKGDRFDAHDFVADVMKRGAAAAIVSRARLHEFADKQNLLAVDDPLIALQTLARSVRRQWGKTVIGVTGSAGKTTTKEAIAQVLSTRYNVLKSEGNFNNHIGLPLQLLRIQPETEFYVSEMGMNHAGEIAALAKIAEPDIGVVTMVAPVHLEFFDSIAGIAKAKEELIDALPEDGVAVLNADDPFVSKFGTNRENRVTFGLGPTADIRAVNIVEHGSDGVEFDVVAEKHKTHFRLPLVGKHNIYNALAAIVVGTGYGLGLDLPAEALASLRPSDKRGQLVEIGGATVINDCYNSTPKALESMVDALMGMPADRHIVVAGEMLELGSAGEELHRECGRYMAERGVSQLIGVRGLAKPMVEAARQAGLKAEFFATPEEAGEWLAANVVKSDAVLLKASRGVKLEKAIDEWKRHLLK